MLKALSALFVMLWAIALAMLMMAAGASRRVELTRTERLVLPWARKMARRRDQTLRRAVAEFDVSISDQALIHLHQEDVLGTVSLCAMFARAVAPMLLSLAAGISLAVRVACSDLGVWGPSLALYVFMAVWALTIFVILWTDAPQQSRWTTCVISGNACRALKSLIEPFESSSSDAVVFQPRHASVVRALENFALSMEQYAVRRALPNGSTPMLEVVKIYGGAASSVRSLRDAVEIDREGGRQQALTEVKRMIEVLASSSVRDLAPPDEAATVLLDQNTRKKERRRQLTILVLFTVVGALLCLVLVKAGLTEAVAGVVVTAVLGAWTGHLRLSGGRAG
ncbi:hypothetical protein ACPCTO_11740 [Streptomyces olivoreticuli]